MTNKLLNAISIRSISLSDFPSSFEDFKKKTRQITTECDLDNPCDFRPTFKDIFDEFLEGKPAPNYDVIPEGSEISSNWLLRYLIVHFNNTYYLMFFHVVDEHMMKEEYRKNRIDLSYPVVSLDGSDIPQEIYDALRRCGVTTVREVSFEESDYWDINYFNTIDDFRNMMSSKWRSKHGINKLSQIVHLETTLKSADDILELSKRWCETKNGGHSGIHKALSLSSKREDIFIPLTWYLNGQVVAFALVSKNCNSMFVHICKTCSQFAYSYLNDKSFTRNIEKYLGDYVTYSLHEFCFSNGMNALYYFGGVQEDSVKDDGSKDSHNKASYHRLQDYKEKIFKNKIYYQKITL